MHLLLNVYQGPHSPSYILKDWAEPLATVGKINPPFRGLTRGWRCSLRTLPAYSSHVTCFYASLNYHLISQ